MSFATAHERILQRALTGDAASLKSDESDFRDLVSLYKPDEATKTAIRAGVLPRLLTREENRTAVQIDENHIAKVVITCEPEGASLMMGAMHPKGSLYERPVNMLEAKATHAAFRELLRKNGCKVLTLRQILQFDVDTSVTERLRLESLAAMALTYRFTTDVDIPDDLKRYAGQDYKEEVMKEMSTEQLIETIMIRPTVTLIPTNQHTGLTSEYSFKPLSNLIYMRDQQITTVKGIVLGCLKTPQRRLETAVMHFAFSKLGLGIAGHIDNNEAAPEDEQAFLEGGDFFPAGEDLALLGIGLRTNYNAARQLMDKDLLGTRRFAVVRDELDQSQDRMHLDCVFSILSDNCCLMLETIMGSESGQRRLVDVWERKPDVKGGWGKYTLTKAKTGIEFASFMQAEGYHIMRVSHEHQLLYGCNCLNLGAGRVIAVHEATARKIVQFEPFKGHVQYIDFSAITSMYGAVHCASQVVVRAPLPNPDSTDPGDIEGTRRGKSIGVNGAALSGVKRARAVQGVSG